MQYHLELAGILTESRFSGFSQWRDRSGFAPDSHRGSSVQLMFVISVPRIGRIVKYSNGYLKVKGYLKIDFMRRFMIPKGQEALFGKTGVMTEHTGLIQEPEAMRPKKV